MAARSNDKRRALVDQLLKKRGLSRQAPAAIQRRPGAEGTLSFAQERFLFLDRLDPGSPAYNLAAALRIEGRLDLEKLERVLQLLVGRHDVLRTACILGPDGPTAKVYPTARIPFSVDSLSVDTADGGHAQIRCAITDEVERGFSLEQVPLLRAKVIRLGAESHIVVVTAHHAVADATTISILLQEAMLAYAALLRGEVLELPEAVLRYSDFAAWQREQAKGEEWSPHLAFWKRALDGATPPLDLHARDDASAPGEAEVGSARVSVDAPLLAAVRRLATEHRATPYMVFIACLGVLLGRVSGQRDVCIGSPISLRERPELREVAGFFLNTLVMRVAFGDLPSFAELLERVRTHCLGALSHKEFPYERLVAQLTRDREHTSEGLFRVMFAHINEAPPPIEIAGLTITKLEVPPPRARFDLAVHLEERADDCTVTFHHRTSVISRAAASGLARAYIELLESFMRDPTTSVLGPSLLDAATSAAVVQMGMGEVRAWEGPATAHELVLERAALFRDRVAISSGDQGCTFGDLAARAQALAATLSSRGIGPGAIVGVYFHRRSIEGIVSLLAALLAGAAYLPLDPAYPPARLRFMLEDAGVRLVMTDAASLSFFEGETLDPRDASPAPPPSRVLPRVAPDAPAYVIYTSGSTGKPKAAVLHHRGLCNLVHAQIEAFAIDHSSRVLQFAATGFDASVSEIFTSLVAGATLFLESSDRLTRELYEVLRERRITVVTLPPSLLLALEQDELPDLRTVVSAGELCPPEVARRWARPGRRVLNAYGPTEATVCATIGDASDAQLRTPIGTAIANVQTYVVESGGKLQIPGFSGELWIGGLGVGIGYLNRADLNDQCFTPNGFTGLGRVYRTGDQVRMRNDCALEVLGRLDDQVKVRGYRLELGEIESVLAAHPGVAEVAAVVIRHDGSPRLEAVVVARAGHQLDEVTLHAHVGASLPSYMVPTIRVHPSLPRTPNGKIDRQALANLSAKRPDFGGGRAPRGKLEEAIARAWGEVLGREVTSAQENFFAVGGDSILALRLVSRVRAAGLRIQPRQLFDNPTIAELAQVARPSDDDTVLRQPIAAPPLTPIQAWFFERFPSGENHWNQALALEAPAGASVSVIERCVTVVAQAHDAFGLRFRRGSTGWTQRFEADSERIAVEHVEIGPADDPQKGLARVAERLQRSLDIEAGPVAAAAIVRPAHGPALLLLVAHHLIIDAVSWRILIEDLCTTYQSGAGTGVSDVPTGASFGAWAQALSQWASTEAARRHLPYWAEQVASIAPALAERPARAGDATSHYACLDPGTTSRLLTEALRPFRTSAEEVVLAATLMALSAELGRKDVVLDMENQGRGNILEEIDTSRTVGWFTTSFPVRFALPEASSAIDALIAVKEQLRAAPKGGADYGVLRYLSHESSLDVMSFPDVAFNFLGNLDRAASEGAPFRPLRIPTGASVAPGSQRTHALEITAGVIDGRLEVRFVASGDPLASTRAARLSSSVVAHLESLVRACTRPGEGRYTPSDFRRARITEDQLRAVLRAVADPGVTDGGNIVDILPCTTLQRSMLFHVLHRNRGAYVAQVSCLLEGPLHSGRLEAAWNAAISRHSGLRTAFVSAGLDLQVVLRRAPIPFRIVDLEGAAEDTLEALMQEEREAGFALGRAPLMRVTLARYGERRHRLVWTHHHLALDGWSLPITLRDVFYAYDSRAEIGESLGPAPGMMEVHDWLARSDPASSASFFRELLGGSRWPTPLSFGGMAKGRGAGEVHANVDADQLVRVTERLTSLRVTLAVAVQACWGLLVGHYAACDAVVVGATFGGRPPDLVGSEHMVGLFSNALPLPLQVARDTGVRDWLLQAQSTAHRLSEHQHCALLDVHHWLGVAGGKPLFESLVVFENYPVHDTVLQGLREVTISDVEVRDRGSHPITLFAGIHEGALSIRIVFDQSIHDAVVLARVAEELASAVVALGATDDRPLSSLVAGCGAPPAPAQAQAAPYSGRTTEVLAPRTALEAELLEVWSRVLPPQPIGIADRFFDLDGASSLTALDLIRHIERSRSIAVPLSALLEAQTIERMALILAGDETPPVTDLVAEAALDPDIVIGAPCPLPPPGRAALLTGATGFLGLFLLEELFRAGVERVVCIVRGRDRADARERLRSSLARAPVVVDERRVDVLAGDLALPQLGLTEGEMDALSEGVDCIVHNGAHVDFIRPYTALKASNVLATKELLRLATRGRIKPLAYVSSLAVYAAHHFESPITEDVTPENPSALHNGYSQSKWVADALVRAAGSRGLPTIVFRCGGIAGHSVHGTFNESDFVVQAMRACAVLRAAPDMGLSVDLTPVDYVSRAIAHLVTRPESWGRVFHLANPSPMTVTEIAQWACRSGEPLELVAVDEWRSRLARAVEDGASELAEVAALVRAAARRTSTDGRGGAGLGPQPRFLCERAREILVPSGIECPETMQLLPGYIQRLRAAGWISPPRR